MLSRDLGRILFWIRRYDRLGSMRYPILESSPDYRQVASVNIRDAQIRFSAAIAMTSGTESSPDCKRAASVNIDTNVTRLQSCLKPNRVAHTTKRGAQLDSKQNPREGHVIAWLLH